MGSWLYGGGVVVVLLLFCSGNGGPKYRVQRARTGTQLIESQQGQLSPRDKSVLEIRTTYYSQGQGQLLIESQRHGQ